MGEKRTAASDVNPLVTASSPNKVINADPIIIDAPARPRPKNVQDFLDQFLADATAVARDYDIPTSVMLAQSGVETLWGAKVAHNAYFGIKSYAAADGGPTVSFKTPEETKSGQRVTITDSFRAYGSFKESAIGYGEYITTNSLYVNALKFRRTDALNFAAAVAKKYATASNYGTVLRSALLGFSLLMLDDFWKPSR
jgi:flagellum-specific peptidoglycan hydrolase FlgJ